MLHVLTAVITASSYYPVLTPLYSPTASSAPSATSLSPHSRLYPCENPNSEDRTAGTATPLHSASTSTTTLSLSESDFVHDTYADRTNDIKENNIWWIRLCVDMQGNNPSLENNKHIKSTESVARGVCSCFPSAMPFYSNLESGGEDTTCCFKVWHTERLLHAGITICIFHYGGR